MKYEKSEVLKLDCQTGKTEKIGEALRELPLTDKQIETATCLFLGAAQHVAATGCPSTAFVRLDEEFVLRAHFEKIPKSEMNL